MKNQIFSNILQKDHFMTRITSYSHVLLPLFFQNGTLDPSYVMVSATDGGSLLRETHRLRLIELTKTLQDNVSVEFRGKHYEFRDLCEPYCELNTAFLAFLKLYDPTNPATFTYPQVEIFGTQAFIGEFFEFSALAPYLHKRSLSRCCD